MNNYGNQSATELTSSLITQVIPASYYGRISHLFVQKNIHIYGTFDEMNSELKITDQDAEGANPY